jgi:hypothetical protein
MNSGSSLFSLGRLVLVYGCLVLVPLLLIGRTLDYFARARQDELIRATSEELAQILGRFRRMSTMTAGLEGEIRRLANAIVAGESLTGIQRRLPEGAVTLFLFDAAGKRLMQPGLATDMKVSSERFFGLLRKLGREPGLELTKAEKSMADAFLGSSEAVPLIAGRRGKLLDLRGFAVNRLCGWFALDEDDRSGRHVLALVDTRKVPPTFVIRGTLAGLSDRLPSSIQLGWINLADPRQGELSGKKRISPRLRALVLRDRISREFRRGRQVVQLMTLVGGLRIFGFSRIPMPSGLLAVFRPLLVLIFLLVTMLFGLLWRVRYRIGISVRTKLIGILGAGGLIGVLGFMVFADLYRQVRQSAEIRRNQQFSQKTLEKIDANFLPSFDFLLRDYQEMVREIEASPGKYQERLRQLCDQAESNLLYGAFLIDTQGELLFHGQGATSRDGRRWLVGEYGKTVGNLGKQILSIYNYQSSLAIDAGFQDDSVMAKALTKPSENILRRRGGFQIIRLAGEDTLNFVDIVHDSKGRGWGLLFLIHDTRALETRYLKETVRKISRNTPYRLCALPKVVDSGLPVFPEDLLSRYEEDLHRLVEMVDQTGGVIHRIGKIREGAVLMTGLPGRVLEDFHMVLHSPFQPIREEMESLQRSFAQVSTGVLLFAVLLGFILGDQLIRPIDLLLAGVRKLVSRSYDQPLTPESGDELGQIALGINNIMTDLRDRLCAKGVEEHLLPKEPIVCGDLSLHGWLATSEDFGGTFYDFFRRDAPERIPATGEEPGDLVARSAPSGEMGRTVFLLVDFSGFGLCSALLNAIMKMAVRLLSETPCRFPGEVVAEVFAHFSEQLKRIPTPRILLGFLENPGDPEGEWVLRVASFGRFVGMVRLPGESRGESLFPEIASLAANETGVRETTRDFPAGARLLIGTPGIVSGAASDRDSSCISAFQTALAERPDWSAAEVGGTLFEQLRSPTLGGEKSEEFALLLVARSREVEA